ncbi:MAG TPA: two-component regulator propeller domain-containing protein [Bryobacteraceae bacterium]|nr:two-component regulator propeller domain-containing protein [Bryobacteraceae bacterium]
MTDFDKTRPTGRTIRLGLFLALSAATAAWGLDPRRAVTQYGHGVWTTADGLPQDSVRGIAQTNDGYLWIATMGGLARFDGVSFTVFNSQNTPVLGRDEITTLAADPGGGLWIGTGGAGVLRFLNGKFTQVISVADMHTDNVRFLNVDSRGVLWIGADGGLSRYDHGTVSSVFRARNGLAVHSGIESPTGTLWFGTDGGLKKLENGSFTTYTARDGLPADPVWGLAEGPDGEIWIGTRPGGLSVFRHGAFHTYTTRDGLTSNAVIALMRDHDANLWIGTEGGGINRLAGGKFDSIPSRTGGLSNKVIRCLYEDREGSLWLGTAGGGLFRLKDYPFIERSTREDLPSDVIRTISQDRWGDVWLGTGNGVARIVADGRALHYSTKDGLTSDLIWPVMRAQNGDLWAGSDEGVLHYFRMADLANPAARRTWKLDGAIRMLFEQSDGSVWVATTSQVVRFQNGQQAVFGPDQGLAATVLTAIAGRPGGGFWVGTRRGIQEFRDGRFLPVFGPAQGLVGTPFSMLEDSDRNLWAMTSAGLNRISGGKVTTFNKTSGLPDAGMFQMIEDNFHTFWITTRKGVWRVSKRSFDAVAEGRARTLEGDMFGASDGVRGTSDFQLGYWPAVCRMRDGTLWFASFGGVLSVDPSRMSTNRRPPPVFVERVTAGNREAAAEHGRILAGSNLEFHYTALSFISPDRVRFRYQLEGFDKEWQDAGTRRVAYFTNLPPGSYRFRVVACNNDGVWNLAGASYSFVLTPRFYQTMWFYALCGLAVSLAGAAAYRWRVRGLRAREKWLRERVGERTVALRVEVQERLRAEEALQQANKSLAGAERQYRRIFNGVTDAVLVCTLLKDGSPGRFIQVNDQACRCLGYSREELLQMGKYDIVAPEAKATIAGIGQSLLAEGQTLFETVNVTKDGRRIPVEVNAHIFDIDGTPAFLSSVRDISERKAAEAAKAKLEAELSQAQKLESIGRLAGGVAHDFNNLLTIINGYSGLLLKGLDVADRLRPYAEEIGNAGARAASLTEQLLAFSRKQVIAPRLLDLNSTIQDAMPMLQRLIGEDIALTTRFGDSLGPVVADPGQIHQVLMNLVANARDAMPDGGKLSVETANADLTADDVGTQHDAAAGRWVLMTVSDTGRGMDEMVREHVFEPFFTTKGFGKGTGLGLSTVYGIIRQSGGWIDVRSEVGVGTSFKVYLPRKDGPAPPERRPAVASTQTGGETILLVEDQDAVRTLTSAALKRLGYRVIEASDGEDAILVVAGHPERIHLLLTDVVLPGMNGKELSERLKALRPDLKVMFTSGYTADVIAQRGVLDQGLSFLQKPYDLHELAAKVGELLGNASEPAVEP